MKLLPILVLAIIFLFLGIMAADAIGLQQSGFRNMFVLVWVGWGLLIGAKIAAASGGQR